MLMDDLDTTCLEYHRANLEAQTRALPTRPPPKAHPVFSQHGLTIRMTMKKNVLATLVRTS